jgi:hypothetical protein
MTHTPHQPSTAAAATWAAPNGVRVNGGVRVPKVNTAATTAPPISRR